MFSFKNITRGIFILLICLGLGVTFAKIYRPESKNIKIYKLALKDFENENYPNSYFLFSKIGAISALKPFALYRQSMCAKKLGDQKSELKAYQQLIRYYPNHKFANEARYNAGQLIIDENPNLAYKYFDRVAQTDNDDDYRHAAEFYKARISAAKIRYSGKKASKKKSGEIEDALRNYLKKYPDGRLAASAASVWQKFNPEMTDTDKVLTARAYLFSKDYDDAIAVIAKVPEKDIWAVKSELFYAKKDYKDANALVLKWINQENKNIDKSDYNRVIDAYSNLYDDNKTKYDKLSELLSKAKGNKRDYIWNLKCAAAPAVEKYSCYDGLYTAYPDGKYAKNALFQAFRFSLINGQYQKSRALASTFLDKFGNSKEVPMVMFWVAKIDRNSEFFNKIIKQYPDSYYAYRSFWILRGLRGATISGQIKNKPVVYPYRFPGDKTALRALISADDYEMIKKFTGDKFIASWVEYQKGNYAASMVIAKEAMEKLDVKPDKSDLRWRLVYPQNYIKQVKKYAALSQNNEALIMAILREESSFNTKAQSAVGAMGLMQLMPETAQDIASRKKIPLETIYLINPETNIKFGNLYYAELKNNLKNEVSAVAAYNGGIGAVTGWEKTLKYSDVDEFIIKIPYDETRHYVEKIFGSYWNYTRIYQR